MYELVYLILEKAVSDDTENVQEAFSRILHEIDPRNTLTSLKKILTEENNKSIKREAVCFLKSIDMPEEVVKVLEIAFNDNDPLVQEEAVKSLRYIDLRNIEIINIIEKALRNNNDKIRMEAMFSLIKATILKNDLNLQNQLKCKLKELRTDPNDYIRKTADFLLQNPNF